MRESEFKGVLATLAAAWPNSVWQSATDALAWSLLSGLEANLVKAAVGELIREGREFCPVPGAIYSKAQEMRPSPLALPPPEPFALSEEENAKALEEMRRGLTPEQIGEADSLANELRMASPEARMRMLGESIRKVAKAREMAS